jgi:predicted RNase H-like nuclease (RuvC/YqgF family)
METKKEEVCYCETEKCLYKQKWSGLVCVPYNLEYFKNGMGKEDLFNHKIKQLKDSVSAYRQNVDRQKIEVMELQRKLDEYIVELSFYENNLKELKNRCIICELGGKKCKQCIKNKLNKDLITN